MIYDPYALCLLFTGKTNVFENYYCRVDDDTIAREEAGLGGDDAMEVELDPLTLLEMGMGEDFIQLED